MVKVRRWEVGCDKLPQGSQDSIMMSTVPPQLHGLGAGVKDME